MEKRIITLIAVVILGVLLGVSVVSHEAKNPLLKEILKQQSAILESQSQLQKKVEGGQPGGFSSGQANELLQRQTALEQRVTTLETQLGSLKTAIQQAMAARRPTPQGPPPEDLSTVHEIPVSHSPVIGNKNAPVTIVEFMDFQCPFCHRFHPPMEEAAKAFPGKVNYIIKNFPLSFHPNARPAAKAAFAAGEQGKYAEMADALIKNGNNLSDATYKKIAADLKLNVNKFWKDYTQKDAQWEKYIQEDMALGSKVDVRGTPTYYINGRKTNARDVASWKQAIEQALKAKN